MRVAALLRGVNLGPHRRVSMSQLRTILADLGNEDVETYLQSGNVVFSPSGGRTKNLDANLAAGLLEATGHDIGVVVRTNRQLEKIVADAPYPVDDPTRVVVAFFAEPIGWDALGLREPETYLPDELTLQRTHAYALLPHGQARSKLMETLTKRKQPTVVTVRNWRTVTALAELTRS